MTHARIPDFSVPLGLPMPRFDGDAMPWHADPILAAIDDHNEAWSVFQVAPAGDPSVRAEDACDAALMALLGCPCATRAGAFALLRHLRWFLQEEASNASGHGDAWAVAIAREADLTLLLGADGIRRIPVALPSGRLVGPSSASSAPMVIEAGPAPAPATIRNPKLTPVRFGRVLASAGELLACMVLVGGGCLLTGLASLL